MSSTQITIVLPRWVDFDTEPVWQFCIYDSNERSIHRGEINHDGITALLTSTDRRSAVFVADVDFDPRHGGIRWPARLADLIPDQPESWIDDGLHVDDVTADYKAGS